MQTLTLASQESMPTLSYLWVSSYLKKKEPSSFFFQSPQIMFFSLLADDHVPNYRSNLKSPYYSYNIKIKQ